MQISYFVLSCSFSQRHSSRGLLQGVLSQREQRHAGLLLSQHVLQPCRLLRHPLRADRRQQLVHRNERLRGRRDALQSGVLHPVLFADDGRSDDSCGQCTRGVPISHPV